MAVSRKMGGLCALLVAFVDISVAFLLLWFATLTFCSQTVISPFNALLIRLEAFCLNHSTRKISTVQRTICRLLQIEGEVLELGGFSGRLEFPEAESFHGPTMSRRESTLSTYSGDVSSLLNDSETTERTDVNLEDDNMSISSRKLTIALKEEKMAHAKLRRELEAERRAAETAAFETMAKIAFLQEEKANIEREARQYRIEEGSKSRYKDDQIENLEEKLIERDRQIYIIEKENEAYRQILKERGLNSSVDIALELKEGKDESSAEFQEKGMVSTELFLTPHCTDADRAGSFFDKQCHKRSRSHNNNTLDDDNNVDTSQDNGVHDVDIINNDQSKA